MVIYNVTVKINTNRHDEWLAWMRNTHIPDVMTTGYFTAHKMLKVLVDDTDGITYTIQYHCESMEKLNDYYENCATKLQEEHIAKFKDEFVAFRTLLKEV